MKKQLIPVMILLITTGILVSFTNSRKAAAKKADNGKSCTCTSVDPSSVHVSLIGHTNVVTWNEPTGSDYILSYNVGGYFSCSGPGAGPFGPITAYGTATQINNSTLCPDGTVSIITNCQNSSNYCSSSPTVVYW